jgi:hypothetical protein
MSKASVIARCRSVVLAGLLGASLSSCKKDEPPPPLPAAPKAAEPVAAEAPLQLVPEDAGKPPEPVAAPKSGGTKASGGLAACCKALRQNAESAPEPNKGYMTYAAGICDMAAKGGQDKASIVGAIRTALKGAGLPADCK